ncbi:acyltransferase family protein [Actinoplanes sp. NPDC049802]|uniref:acyltransferase family protein n=1 Tax=Actinoplanes sp. NPDC049802 TaxID=3154742 RepID=UPI003402156B
MRNRYLDVLRAAAIVRVVVYHHFGWPWLSVVLPAMGVMFAVAGSLTAASLSRRAAGPVVVSRLRRLLPPVWLLGLVTVPVMLHFGWASQTGGEHPFRPATLLFWVLPLGDPPGSDEAAFVWDALWYVRTYLWLVLLSPLLYPLFRRVGWPLLAAPLLGMAVLQRGDFGLPGSVESALWDLTTYGACWLAGFAHRDGRLGRMSPGLTVAASAALGGLGLYWLAQGHADTGWDLNEASEAQAVYSLAAVLLLLRWEPSTAWLSRSRPAARLVTLFNARAVTIYLWHGVAIAAVWPLLERIHFDDLNGLLEPPVTLAVAFGLTAVAVAVFGWAEDLAARRRPRLWPGGDGTDRGEPAGDPPAAPRTEPVAGPGAPIPAGWPEVGRGEPAPSPDPLSDAVTRRITAAQRGDLPVAGRPVPGYGSAREGYGGAPWAGHTPARDSAGDSPDRPLPLRFSRPDGGA